MPVRFVRRIIAQARYRGRIRTVDHYLRSDMRQETVWKLFELGSVDAAARRRDDMERELQQEEVLEIRKHRRIRGKTQPKLLILQNGLKGIFKTRHQKQEIAGYRLDKLLGLNVVPVTVGRNIDGTDGSLQYALTGGRTLKWLRKNELAPPTFRNEATVRLFNYLTQNRDADNPSNTLVIDGDRLVAIDNGDAFPDGCRATAADIEAVKAIPPAIRDRLERLPDAAFIEVLDEFLGEAQVAGVLHRRRILTGS